MEDVAEIMMLADRVRETAYAIHVFHGNGHLERIYDNALAHRLRRSGHRVDQQCSLNVFDEDGTLLGSYIADLVINGKLLIELKAVPRIIPEHIAQIIGYLKASRLQHGLLLNFGGPTFQIRKFVFSR